MIIIVAIIGLLIIALCNEWVYIAVKHYKQERRKK